MKAGSPFPTVLAAAVLVDSMLVDAHLAEASVMSMKSRMAEAMVEESVAVVVASYSRTMLASLEAMVEESVAVVLVRHRRRQNAVYL